MPFNFAVCRIEYIAAARSPPEWLPANSQLRLPRQSPVHAAHVGLFTAAAGAVEVDRRGGAAEWPVITDIDP